MRKSREAHDANVADAIAEAKRMHVAGVSIKTIATEAGVSEGAVRKWLKQGNGGE